MVEGGGRKEKVEWQIDCRRHNYEEDIPKLCITCMVGRDSIKPPEHTRSLHGDRRIDGSTENGPRVAKETRPCSYPLKKDLWVTELISGTKLVDFKTCPGSRHFVVAIFCSFRAELAFLPTRVKLRHMFMRAIFPLT